MTLFNDEFYIVIDENVIEGHISCSARPESMMCGPLSGVPKNSGIACEI